MRYDVVTIKPGGGRKIVQAELDEKGIVNVDIAAGQSATVLSVSLDDFISLEISFTCYNKTEGKARLKKYQLININNEIIRSNVSNFGNGLSFNTEFNLSVDNMNIVITNNNSYNIIVSIAQKLIGK